MTATQKADGSLPPTEMLTVDGQRVRIAARQGDGTRPPLLLMNGLGVSLEIWQPFVNELRPGTGVICFDVPGVGQSPPPARPYRMCRMASLVGSLLDLLDVPRVDVLGVSWGGALAQQFAFQGRRRCRRLILVSTSIGLGIPGRPSVVREMLTGRRFYDAEHAHRVWPRIYGGKARLDEGGIPVIFQTRPDRRGLLYQKLAVVGWTSLPFAPLIRQPTLILMGDEDPIIPPVNGRLTRAVLRKSELHIFHDGHLGIVTSADEIAPVVEKFLDRE